MLKRASITALLFGLIFVFASAVRAQSGARSITIIPPKFELFGNPGEQITDKLRVRNDSDIPATYEILVEDFTSTGEEGQVVLEENQPDTQYSLARWLEPESKDLVLQPNEEKSISFTINIPRNAEPGGHYASILFQASAGETMPGSAAVSQRVGALVLLRVSGNVTEKASVETFEAPTYNKATPLNLTLRLKNEGNTHVRPKGTVVITNMFNQKVDELPLNGLNVLPGVTRKMDTEWKRGNLLGYYTATLVATYGQQNLPLTAATKFIVISPTAIILIGVGSIAALVFVIALISGRNRLMKAMKVIVSGK